MRLYGINPVIERLRANPKSIRKIYLQVGNNASSFIQKRAAQCTVPVFLVEQSRIRKIARDKNTQGVVADVDDFEYTPYQDLLEQALKKKRCLVFLDEITDPQNLGAIIRSMACLGKFSIVLPTHDSVSVTEAVLRVASGGENYVPVSAVANISKAIVKAKDQGFLVVGTVVKNAESLLDVKLTHPLALVVGSEQKGIREVTKKLLDKEISIPMAIDTMSFNVAQAAAILCYEITRQKNKKGQTEE